MEYLNFDDRTKEILSKYGIDVNSCFDDSITPVDVFDKKTHNIDDEKLNEIHKEIKEIICELDPEQGLDDDEHFERWRERTNEELSIKLAKWLPEKENANAKENKKKPNPEVPVDDSEEEDYVTGKCDLCLLREYGNIAGGPVDWGKKLTAPFEEKLEEWLKERVENIEASIEEKEGNVEETKKKWVVTKFDPPPKKDIEDVPPEKPIERKRNNSKGDSDTGKGKNGGEISRGGSEKTSREKPGNSGTAKKGEAKEESKRPQKERNLKEEMEKDINSRKEYIAQNNIDFENDERVRALRETIRPKGKGENGQPKEPIRLMEMLFPKGIAIVDFVLPKYLKEFELNCDVDTNEEGSDDDENVQKNEAEIDIIKMAVADPYPNIINLKPTIDDEGEITGYSEVYDPEVEDEENESESREMRDLTIKGIMGEKWEEISERVIKGNASLFLSSPMEKKKDHTRTRNSFSTSDEPVDISTIEWIEDDSEEEEEFNREKAEEGRILREAGERIVLASQFNKNGERIGISGVNSIEDEVWPDWADADLNDFDSVEEILEMVTGGPLKIPKSIDGEELETEILDAELPEDVYKNWDFEIDIEDYKRKIKEAEEVYKKEQEAKKLDEPVPFLTMLNKEIEMSDESGKPLDHMTKFSRETLTWPYIPRYTFLDPYKSYADLKDYLMVVPELKDVLSKYPTQSEVAESVKRLTEKAKSWWEEKEKEIEKENQKKENEKKEEQIDPDVEEWSPKIEGYFEVWKELDVPGDADEEPEEIDPTTIFPPRKGIEEEDDALGIEEFAETQKDHEWRTKVEEIISKDGIKVNFLGRPWSLESSMRRSKRRIDWLLREHKELFKDVNDDEWWLDGMIDNRDDDTEGDEDWEMIWSKERERLEKGELDSKGSRERRLYKKEMKRREQELFKLKKGGDSSQFLWTTESESDAERDGGDEADLLFEEAKIKDKETQKESAFCGRNNRSILNISVESHDNVTGHSFKYQWAFLVKSMKASRIEEVIPYPAITYPFPLDPFQIQAIVSLEQGYNIFVAAHTSAGKTVVAEYAIALSLKHGTKVVYTSPIKALSNQKYSEFRDKFGNVGLITGDIQVNDDAPILVMTTEILRSMLYNTSQRIQELEFVVFDEVHYINDEERGHVWEEVLILLGSNVTVVMLSATVPNMMEFADWVGRTKKRKVAVCTTSYRPVPLTYYLYVGQDQKSRENCFLIKEGDKGLISTGYIQANQCLQNDQGQFHRRFRAIWEPLVFYLKKNHLLPTVVFCFSRKKCDDLSKSIGDKGFVTAKEKSHIKRTFWRHIKGLDPDDREIKQVKAMESLLEFGVAVHHSGILPILKEIVEILFKDGFVKLLFATETFAVGVNMPARTVVFERLMKFDGNCERFLTPAEFIQMAGRAGRRGRDKSGCVILFAPNQKLLPRETELNDMMCNPPSILVSRLKLRYSMILATLMKGEFSIQSMLERSYMENKEQGKLSQYQAEIENKVKEEEDMKKELKNSFDPKLFNQISHFIRQAFEYFALWDEIRESILLEPQMLKYLVPGRLVRVTMGDHINSLGLLLNPISKVLVFKIPHQSKIHLSPGVVGDEGNWRRVLSLLNDALPSLFNNLEKVVPGRDTSSYEILNLPKTSIIHVLDHKVSLSPSDMAEALLEHERASKSVSLRHKCPIMKLKMALDYLEHSYGKRLEPINERSLINEVSVNKISQLWQYEEFLTAQKKSNFVGYMDKLEKVFSLHEISRQRLELGFKISKDAMLLYQDYKNKMNLLRKRNYVDESDIVSKSNIKGMMASRVGKYELVVTELLLNNALKECDPKEAAALFSCLVFQGRFDLELQKVEITPGLTKLKSELEKIILEIMNDERLFGIDAAIDESHTSEYLKINFGLMRAVYCWASGESFNDILSQPGMENVQAGLMVRWIQQLLETLKDVESAARVMGDPSIPLLLRKASETIKRGIVFAPSIYALPNSTSMSSHYDESSMKLVKKGRSLINDNGSF